MVVMNAYYKHGLDVFCMHFASLFAYIYIYFFYILELLWIFSATLSI